MDELKQALEQQKLNGLEEDFIEVLSRALEIPREVVIRFAWAYQRLNDDAVSSFSLSFPVESWESVIPEELRTAISKAMSDGALNVAITRAIKTGGALTLPVELLIKDEKLICHGCPESLPCLAENLYSPSICYLGRKANTSVNPLKVVGKNLIVEAKQPAGRYTIPLADIYTNTWKRKNHYER
jgi:hypothetical protein